MKGFKFNLSCLLDFQEPETKICGEEKIPYLEVGRSKFSFSKKVKFNLIARRISQGVTVEGKIQSQINLNCSRCLKKFPFPLHCEVREIFAEPEKKKFFLEEAETFEIINERIDLEPMIKQLFILSLPMKPLCNQNCLGLCPKCGKDLNQGNCSCEKSEIDIRWEPLKKLKEAGAKSSEQGAKSSEQGAKSIKSGFRLKI